MVLLGRHVDVRTLDKPRLSRVDGILVVVDLAVAFTVQLMLLLVEANARVVVVVLATIEAVVDVDLTLVVALTPVQARPLHAVVGVATFSRGSCGRGRRLGRCGRGWRGRHRAGHCSGFNA